MTPNVPVLKAREVVRILERLGFVEVRQRGSHKQFRHADGRSTSVPFHERDISPILLRQICKDEILCRTAAAQQVRSGIGLLTLDRKR
jgi:predicted RNA binding protein YcfA (HicA-like mRNA interferase family)